MTTRRGLITRLGLLALAGGGLFMVRDRLPWPPLAVRFADGRATPWLPLPEAGGLIEVAVTVNGAPVRAVIDSGAQFSAIDRALAERLDLDRPLAAPLLAYGVSGSPSLTHTLRLDLALPGLTIPGLRAAALDIAAISQATGRDFQLLIGRDVLRAVALDADFPRRRARLIAREAVRTPADAIPIPLADRGGAPVTVIRIEAAPTLEVLVDTGASGTLALSAKAATDAGLLAPGRPVTSAHSVSLGGLSLDRVARAATLQVGPLVLQDADIQIYTPVAGAPGPAGLLGTGAFQPYRMTMDLAGSRLFLTRPGLIVVPPPRGEPRR